jgi:hypothetical protein
MAIATSRMTSARSKLLVDLIKSSNCTRIGKEYSQCKLLILSTELTKATSCMKGKIERSFNYNYGVVINRRREKGQRKRFYR